MRYNVGKLSLHSDEVYCR